MRRHLVQSAVAALLSVAALAFALPAAAQSYSDPDPRFGNTKPVIEVDTLGAHLGVNGNPFHMQCDAGCVAGGGSFNNNADAVATSNTNGQAAAWMYGWNGTGWDRVRVDASKYLYVDLATPIPAGTNNIGVFGYAQGSTTSGQVGPLMQGAVTTSAPTYTTGQTAPFSLDTAGNVRVTAGPANPVTVTVNTPPNDVLTGPTNVTGAADVVVSAQGAGSVTLQITGTFTGLSGLVQASDDNTNWVNIGFYVSNGGAIVTSGTALTATGLWSIPAGGYRSIRFHATAVSTGTAVVSLNASAGALDPPNSVASGGKSVTATNFAATQDQNNGTASANTLRTVEASNATANANKGQGATGSAVPSGAVYAGANSSGNLTGIVQGDTDASFSVASTTSVVITHSSSKVTYVTHYGLTASAAETVTWEYGTGSTCGTGTTTITAYDFAANGGISEGSGLGVAMIVPAGKDLCLVSTSATAKGHVLYTQF